MHLTSDDSDNKFEVDFGYIIRFILPKLREAGRFSRYSTTEKEWLAFSRKECLSGELLCHLRQDDQSCGAAHILPGKRKDT